MAASIGWLAGLQKLVQAGGDLMSARGGGNKKKTPLHTAAEHGHAATVEYIVNMTHGVLNLEIDSMGKVFIYKYTYIYMLCMISYILNQIISS